MTTRITGLATGLDIDSLVKTTMQAYQTKIDQQTQKKDVLEIQQKLYRDLISKSQDFFNKYLDSSSKDCLRKSANYTSVKFTSSSSAVSVKGLAGAEATNYSVVVQKLAKPAKYSLQSSKILSASAIRINGITIDIGANDTEETIASNINEKLKENGVTGIKAKYSQLSKGLVIESINTGRSAEFTLGLLNADGDSTLSPTSSVTNGVNGTAANESYSIEYLRNLPDGILKIGENIVDISSINSNHDLAAEDKENEYLKAVKKAIDDSKSEESTVNSDTNELILKIGDNSTNYSIGTLKEMNSINIGEISVDLTAINTNEGLTAEGKETEYLNAVKKAIDEKSVLPAYSGVDTENKKLVLQAKEIGIGNKFKVNGTYISNGTDNQAAVQELTIDQLKTMSKVTINDVEVDLSGIADDANYLNNAYSKINEALTDETNISISGGVKVVKDDGKISLTTINKGANVALAVTGKNASGSIVFPVDGTGDDITVQGENSIAYISDGSIDESGNLIIYTASSEKNTVTVDNTQFTFNDLTTDTPAKVTGTNDASDLKDKLIKFIDDYNTLVTDLNTAIQTKHNRNYSPLTADQKKSMSESEVKLWEDKVKEGQLYRDSDLTRITDALKSTMRTVMSDSGLSLEKIGIKPVNDYSGTKNGTFSIDEDTLKQAIEDNPEDVMNLFMGGSIKDITPGEGKNGVLNQLWYTLNNEMISSASSLAKKVGFENTSTFTNNTITNDINDYEKKISDMQTQYSTKEQALYSKYASLETAMNNYNSQLSYLSSYFGS